MYIIWKRFTITKEINEVVEVLSTKPIQRILIVYKLELIVFAYFIHNLKGKWNEIVYFSPAVWM
jgi:hypothetical protein